MGELIPSDRATPIKVARALEKGTHVGMLVDQHFGQGVDVMFFGRRCKANPLIAQLARHIGPPCHLRANITTPICTEGSHFCGVKVWLDFPNTPRRI